MEDLRALFPVWAGSEIFPPPVFQTLTSSATSSWLRWRSAGMPKGTRKRPHKRLLCDDFSTFHKCQPPHNACCRDHNARRVREFGVIRYLYAFALHSTRWPVTWLNFISRFEAVFLWFSLGGNCLWCRVSVSKTPKAFFNLYKVMHCQSEHCTYRLTLVMKTLASWIQHVCRPVELLFSMCPC